MIYLTFQSADTNNEPVNIYFDRQPQVTSKLNLHDFSSDSGVRQTAPNGINIKEESFKLTKKNIPVNLLMALNNYLSNLGTQNLVINIFNSPKDFYLSGWSIIVNNSIYGDIHLTLENMY